MRIDVRLKFLVRPQTRLTWKSHPGKTGFCS